MLSKKTREHVLTLKKLLGGSWDSAFKSTIAYLAVNRARYPWVYNQEEVEKDIIALDDLVSFTLLFRK